MDPSFRLFRDKTGEHRWRLQAVNGEIIADSGEGYVNKEDAVHCIELVRRLAPTAGIDDLTTEASGDEMRGAR